jgi:DNA polymerase beta
MQRAGFVTDVITHGSQSSHMICRSTSPPPPGEHRHFRRLDIHVVPFAEYPMQVMYFTGSDEFNIRCRIRATQLGLHMNQSFLQPKGELGALGAPLPVHSERDIFEFLDMPYQDPTKR